MKEMTLKEWSEYKNITLQGYYKDPDYLINTNITIELPGDELFTYMNNEFGGIDEDIFDETGIIDYIKCLYEDIACLPFKWVLKLED